MSKIKYDYNYLLMAIPLLILAKLVPVTLVVAMTCLLCGFEKRK